MTDEALAAAADDLTGHLSELGPDIRVTRRLIAASDGSDPARDGGQPRDRS